MNDDATRATLDAPVKADGRIAEVELASTASGAALASTDEDLALRLDVLGRVLLDMNCPVDAASNVGAVVHARADPSSPSPR